MYEKVIESHSLTYEERTSMAKQTTEYVNIDPNIEYIKIHGLQRSGTNYLSHMVNENFHNTKVLVNLGGWKHGHYVAPWAIGKEVHVIIVAKSPYAWLWSVYKYWGPDKKLRIGPDLTGIGFDEFVRNRVFFERQRDIPFLYRARNPVDHWNNMNFHWTSLRLNNKKLYVVTYEGVLNAPERATKEIGMVLGLKQKDVFVSSDKTFVPSGEDLKPSEQDFVSRDYYLKAGFIEHYTPELIEFVNQELDIDVMVQFGYSFITPEEATKKASK
jgi:hypothetical protein